MQWEAIDDNLIQTTWKCKNTRCHLSGVKQIYSFHPDYVPNEVYLCMECLEKLEYIGLEILR